MTVELKWKRFYDAGSRHHGECYNAVVDRTPGRGALAWLRVNDKRESLVYVAEPGGVEHVVARDTYVLSPHFAGGFLLWVERQGADWRIRVANVREKGVQSTVEPFEHVGRPLSLSSCVGPEATRLVWEERSGKRTRVRLARVFDGRFGEPVDVTDGSFNAYDPDCAIGGDGIVYVAYCAFRGGNYCIMLQKLTLHGELLGEPERISLNQGACVYPSVAQRTSGGVWVSYTEYTSANSLAPSRQPRPFVQHLRSRAQHDFFSFEGISEVRAGIFDGERLWGVHAPDQAGIHPYRSAAMHVFGSFYAGHSHIFEDAEGRARLLLRRHGSGGDIHYEDEEQPLATSGDHDDTPIRQTHPDICIATLEDGAWSEPVRLIRRAHFEGPISFALDGDELWIAFAEDARQTGWNVNAEWFDHTGKLGVGAARVKLSALGRPSYELRPFVVSPPAPSIEEPDVERRDGGFIHAIGQTHSHSNISVCQRSNDREGHLNYRFMQDVQHCDFGGIADHAYNMWHTEMLTVRKMAEYYYFPDEFVAIPAYEWTGCWVKHDGGPFGHVNPLWLEEDGELEFYTPGDTDCPGRSLERLWETYGDRQIVTPPHHVADCVHRYHWRFHHDKFVSVVELFQDIRGSGEQARAPGVTNNLHAKEGHWVLDGLKQGLRFGFIAGGDHSGIARGGVLVKELTRTGIYEALVARRCFASTGLNLQLELTANGRMMGSAIECERADFRLEVRAAERIAEVQVVRNGDTVEMFAVGGTKVERDWRVDRAEDGEFWYCRVVFENGEVAWSSPIWLEES